MNKLIYILLFFPLSLLSQEYGLTFGGNLVYIDSTMLAQTPVYNPIPDPDPDVPVFSEYADSVFMITFESTTAGAFNEDSAQIHFVIGGSTPQSSSAGFGDDPENNVSVVDISANTNGGATRAFRITHESGEYGLEGVQAEGSGALLYGNIGGGPYYELYLSYCFRRNVHAMQLGNKMPSLMAQTTPSDDGMIGTIMFETNSLTMESDSTEVDWYMYFYGQQFYDCDGDGTPAYLDPDDGCPRSEGPEWDNITNTGDYVFYWTTDRWYNITLRYVINGTNDFAQAFVNGVCVSDYYTYRGDNHDFTNGRLPLNVFKFDFFLGGSGEQWAPTVDQTCDFDNITLWVGDSEHFHNATTHYAVGDTLYAVPGWNILEDSKYDGVNGQFSFPWWLLLVLIPRKRFKKQTI